MARRACSRGCLLVAIGVSCGVGDGATDPAGTGGGAGSSASGGASGAVGSGGNGAAGSGGAVAAGGAVAGGSAGSAGRAGNAGKAGNGGAGGTPPADAAGGAGGATRDATSDEGGVFPDASPDVGSPRDASAESAGSDVRDASAEGASDAPSGGFSDARSTTHLDIPAHDPAIIWDGARYSLFATGGNLGIRNSGNLLQWKDAGSVFSAVPAWVTTALGADPGGLWAPDISNFSGKYRVYYAGSTFGSNRSVIGLATNVTLDRASASYAWVDEGLVFESVSSNNYNAIDPNVSFDESGTPWLSFGSFWDGIKMRKLDASTGKLAASDTTLYSLASRGGGAIEAPSIIARGGYYYLFVSFDACCKGASSTYRTMVGRATSITGPYVDKAGAQMMKGAAEELLKTSGRYIGPGGGTAYRDGALYFYVYHYYDGQDGGNAKLAIRPISFSTDGWPTLDEPLFP